MRKSDKVRGFSSIVSISPYEFIKFNNTEYECFDFIKYTPIGYIHFPLLTPKRYEFACTPIRYSDTHSLIRIFNGRSIGTSSQGPSFIQAET